MQVKMKRLRKISAFDSICAVGYGKKMTDNREKPVAIMNFL